MAGKGGKGLLAAKTTAAKTAEKDKGKKAPISRSSRAGLQVSELARTCSASCSPVRGLRFGSNSKRRARACVLAVVFEWFRGSRALGHASRKL